MNSCGLHFMWQRFQVSLSALWALTLSPEESVILRERSHTACLGVSAQEFIFRKKSVWNGLIPCTVRQHQQREDTVIGGLWAIGMAAGLLLIDLTPGYFDMTSYLFGDILLISYEEIKLVFYLDVVVIVLSIYFYNNLLAVCFDEEFARLRGVRVEVFYILLLCLTSLTVVLLVRVVGIIMVIALLTLPAGTAGQFASKMWHTMALAVIFCMFFNWAGLAVSYSLKLSSGPTIIVIAGFTYLVILAAGGIWKSVRN